MKKIFLASLILLCLSIATNAQQRDPYSPIVSGRVVSIPAVVTQQSSDQDAKEVHVLPDQPKPTTIEDLQEKLDLANAKVNYLSAVLIKLIDRIEALEEQILVLEKANKNDSHIATK